MINIQRLSVHSWLKTHGVETYSDVFSMYCETAKLNVVSEYQGPVIQSRVKLTYNYRQFLVHF